MTSQERERLIDGFAKRLKECVDEAGSLYALAKLCGCAIPTLKRYFKGSEPSLTMVVKIAAAANVPAEWLAFGTGARVANEKPVANSDLRLKRGHLACNGDPILIRVSYSNSAARGRKRPGLRVDVWQTTSAK